MKSAIQGWIDCILVLFLIATFTFYLAVSLQNSQARNYHSNAIAQIEASAGNAAVVNECISRADNVGYRITVTPTTLYENIKYYYVTLEYDYNIPFSSLKKTIKIDGYAR